MLTNDFKWTPEMNRRLRNAVNQYNRRLDRLADTGLFTDLPYKTSVTAEKSLISDMDDYYKVLGYLESAQFTKNPGGGAPVEFNGMVIPRFWRDSMLDIAANINSERKEVQDAVSPNFDNLSGVERATAISNSNILPFDVADFQSPEDYEQAKETYFQYEKVSTYMDNYIATWNEQLGAWLGDSGVTEILRRFMDENPKTLKAILERHDLESTIEYIYIKSADKTEAPERHANVVRYWHEMEAKYLN